MPTYMLLRNSGSCGAKTQKAKATKVKICGSIFNISLKPKINKWSFPKMAIYSFKMSNISRSGADNKNNAVAHSAYINRAKFEDERTGTKWNWTKQKDELYFSEVMLPQDAPREYADPQLLWNTVEKNEKRKDARVAKSLILALPTELTAQQNHILTKDFISTNFTRHGIVAEYAIHDIDSHNPHLHIMIAERKLSFDGFAKTKIPELSKVEFLEDLRANWSECQNKHLHKHDHQVSVSHKSLDDQFLDEMNKYDSATSPDEKAEHFIKAVALDRQPLTYINRNNFDKPEYQTMRKNEKEEIEKKKKEAELSRKKARDYEIDQSAMKKKRIKETPCEKITKKIAKSPPKNTRANLDDMKLEVAGSPGKSFGSVLTYIVAKIMATAHNFMIDRMQTMNDKRMLIEQKNNPPRPVKKKKPKQEITPNRISEMGPSRSPILGMDNDIKPKPQENRVMQFRIDKDTMKLSFNKRDINQYAMSFDIKNRNNVLSKSNAKPEKPTNLVMSQRFKNDFNNFTKVVNKHVEEHKQANNPKPQVSNENKNVQQRKAKM